MPESKRRYPRVNRVNEVLREVVAEELERLADADGRIGFLTVTAVVADPDLRHAKVLLASLSDDARLALQEQRVHLQAAIGRQVRLKRTPQLSFEEDPAITSGNRIEDLLRTIPRDHWDEEADDEDAGGA
jgi:ribosome-binding factor A